MVPEVIPSIDSGIVEESKNEESSRKKKDSEQGIGSFS